MATGARGEATLEVDGQEYQILFTNRGLAQAERALGKPVLQLLSAIQLNSLGIGETAQLLAIGLEQARREAKAGGRSYTVDDAWQILDAIGFTSVVGVVLEAVAAVLAYSGDKPESDSPPA